MPRPLLLASLLAVAAAGPLAAEPVELTAGIFLPPQAAYSAPFARWVDHVNDVCGEHVAIRLVGPEAIGPFEQPNALRTGLLDMLGTPGTYYKGDLIEIDTLVLADMPLTEQRKAGVVEALNELHHQKMNAEYLTSYGTGIKFYIWTKEARPDGDFTGMRLRSSPIYEAFFKSLGVTTVQLPPAEVFTALERGTVDGFGWPTWGISDFGWETETGFQHGPGFYNAMNSILVNLDRWSGLAAEARECLTAQAIWLEEQWPGWLAEQDAVEAEVVREQGIEYVDLGPEFAAEAEAVYWDYLMERAPETVGKLRALLGE